MHTIWFVGTFAIFNLKKNPKKIKIPGTFIWLQFNIHVVKVAEEVNS